jgi:2'-5' RNA ligase
VSPRLWSRYRRRPGRQSAVIIPVPEAEPALEAWGLPPTGLGTAPGMPAHVTLLYPFVPAARLDDADVGALRRIVASTCAFPFSLRGVGRFDGVLYLAPDPAAPFAELTRAIARRWPQHPPYNGAYAEAVPHLTVVEGRAPASLARRMQDTLPLPAYASEVWLMAQRSDGSWRLHTRCALSPTASREA